jgi:hypothetical protein
MVVVACELRLREELGGGERDAQACSSQRQRADERMEREHVERSAL